MKKFLFLLSSFSLATITSTSQSFALTQDEMQLMLVGSIGAVCEMHHENNLSYSIAKKYTKQYVYNAEKKYLSKSEIEYFKEVFVPESTEIKVLQRGKLPNDTLKGW